MFSLVLATLSKLKENRVFFLVLVKVAVIGVNSLFSPPLGNLSILNVLANLISLDENSLFWLTLDSLNRTSVFVFFLSMWLKLKKTIDFR